MNILMLHSSSGLYGASKVLITVAREWKKKGHNILVIISEDGPLKEELHNYGIETRIIRLGIMRRKYFSLPGIFNRIRVLSKGFSSLRKIAREQKTDIIYSNTAAVLIGAIVAKTSRIRHIWHIHETILRPVFVCRLIATLMNNCTEKIIVVSTGVMEHWLKFVPDRSKFALIHNGIDTTPFLDNTSSLRTELAIGEERLLIGVIGMIHYIKGHEYFLRLAGKIAKKHPEVAFIIVGDAFPGYEFLYERLSTIAGEENIADRVYYTGFRKDIENVLNALDLLVLPSVLPDSFPTVILEAMAAGKPVVATNQGGAIEMIVPGKTGILIPINEPEKATALMDPLLSDAILRQQMGKEGQKRLLNVFSLEAFHKKITAILE